MNTTNSASKRFVELTDLQEDYEFSQDFVIWDLFNSTWSLPQQAVEMAQGGPDRLRPRIS